MNTDFWDIVLNPVFLIMFGLTAGTFLPLLWSVFVTWIENEDKVEKK